MVMAAEAPILARRRHAERAPALPVRRPMGCLVGVSHHFMIPCLGPRSMRPKTTVMPNKPSVGLCRRTSENLIAPNKPNSRGMVQSHRRAG